MATVTFLEPGTDATQDLSLWTGGGVTAGSGTLASATDQSVTGPRSLKAVNTSSADEGYAISPNTIVTDAGSAVSFRVRIDAVPSTLSSWLLIERDSDGTTVFVLGIDTDGKIVLGNNTGGGGSGVQTAKGTTVLSATTWYRLALAYTLTGASTFTVKVYLNGVLELTKSNDATFFTFPMLSSCITLGLGNQSAGSGFPSHGAMTAWFEDIYIDNRTDLTDPGNVHVTAKRPVANGTTTGFTTQIGAGGSGYGSGHASQVNEQPLSQTNGWSMVGAGSAVTEEYTVEGLSVGDVDLTGATLMDWSSWVFANALAGETASLIVGGTPSNIGLTTTATAFQVAKGSTTYPAGGTDVGLITTTALTTVSLYECGVLVAYVPGVSNLSAFVGEPQTGSSPLLH